MQLDILLNRLGHYEIYGIASDDLKENVSREDVYMELAKMVENDFIHNAGDRFMLDVDLKEMLQNMAQSQHYMHIFSNADIEEKQEYLCYLKDDKAVIAKQQAIRNNKLAITQKNISDIKNQLLIDTLPGYRIYENSLYDMDENENDAVNNPNVEKEDKNIELYKIGAVNSDVAWYCEIKDKDVKQSKEMYVFENDFEPYFLLIDAEGRRRKVYDREETAEYVMGEINGL